MHRGRMHACRLCACCLHACCLRACSSGAGALTGTAPPELSGTAPSAPFLPAGWHSPFLAMLLLVGVVLPPLCMTTVHDDRLWRRVRDRGGNQIALHRAAFWNAVQSRPREGIARCHTAAVMLGARTRQVTAVVYMR